MYHFRDNLYFSRLEDGAVRILKKDPARTEPELDVNIDPGGWASIVAHVSKGGGTAEKFRAAQQLHDSP